MKPNPTICQIWPSSTSLRPLKYKFDYVLSLLKIFTMPLDNFGTNASLIRWHQKPPLSPPILTYSTASLIRCPSNTPPSAGLEFLHFLERAPLLCGFWSFNAFFCLARVPSTWHIPQDLAGPLVLHSWSEYTPWDMLLQYPISKHICIKTQLSSILSSSVVLQRWPQTTRMSRASSDWCGICSGWPRVRQMLALDMC